MPSRVVHFEIHAADPERAAQFYRSVFGWEITKWGGPADYWLCSTGPADSPGINGGLLLRRGPAPSEGQAVNAFVCTLQVDQLDDAWTNALAQGATPAVPKKNRMVDQVILLDKGEYILHYVSDDSHAFPDWNSTPPDDPLSWGVTVSEVGKTP